MPHVPSGDAAVAARSLVKRYGAVEALRGIDLSIPPASFFGLLGPNGAGKSTLIHILTGLATPTSGSAHVLGRDVVREYRAARRLIGVAPQELNFDRFFSILDILAYQGGYFGLSRARARQRAGELLQRLGLWEKRHEKITRLSGGMKRRLMIAKALVHDPPIVILDEPTAGVDVEVRRTLWDYWLGMNAAGKTIVLTTHYLEEAVALCRTLAVIDLGEIIASGPTDDVVRQAGGDLSRYFLKERRGGVRGLSA
ncbi:MAG TPA: ABC transporter ATP-binding protein [Candidatus Polarisedimenticolia bacterium]|nr:ABC transporter ATP-binding protein [Candidatus Polarisedimenticolia bacterium]